jgi:replicative DNA helicase
MPAETPGPDAYRVLMLAPTRRDREATQELLARANIQTGIPGLDAVPYGGLIPHRLYLVDGNPGAGKTTVALQFLLEGVRHGGEMHLHHTLNAPTSHSRRRSRS